MGWVAMLPTPQDIPVGRRPFWLPVVPGTAVLECYGCVQRPSQTFRTTLPAGRQWDTSGVEVFFSLCHWARAGSVPSASPVDSPACITSAVPSGELLEGLIYSSPGSSPES